MVIKKYRNSLFQFHMFVLLWDISVAFLLSLPRCFSPEELILEKMMRIPDFIPFLFRHLSPPHIVERFTFGRVMFYVFFSGKPTINYLSLETAGKSYRQITNYNQIYYNVFSAPEIFILNAHIIQIVTNGIC